MRPAPSRALAAVIVLASAIACAAPARADGPPGSADEASERFRSGVSFYKDGDFTAAQVEFKRAYELAPNWRVLYNLGQTSRELKDHAAALAAFEQYLREGGKDVPPPRKKEVQAFVAELKNKVGTISVTTNVEGAEVLVDDAKIGVTPLASPLVVNVGKHKIAASRAGYRPEQRAVDVAGQQAASVALELVSLTDPVAPTPDRPDAPASPTPGAPAPKKASVAPWIALSVTAAAGVATGVLGGLALAARGDLRDALGTYPGNAADIKTAQDKTRTLALGTDIAAGVTAAGVITTAVLFAVTGGSSDKPARASFGVSPGGVVVGGRF